MKDTELYERIFKRKSIRQYVIDPLEGHVLSEIMAHTSTLKPLYNDIKVEIKILPPEDVKALLFLAKAPHYLALFSEPKDGYLMNAGFMLQQMDLFFSANGIGSCWQGMAKPTKEISKNSELEFVIIMAFGKPNERLHRESVSEFKRKQLQEITDVKGADELLEPARLAPSAMNRQQWFFTGNANTIHAYLAKSSLLTAFMFDRVSRISMGIAICHLWMAAKHFGKEVEFVEDKEAKNNPPPGLEYAITIKLKP
jgi:nitroreductase